MENNNNIINMADDKDRSIREYAMFDPNTLNTSILRLSQFEFKSIIFQILQNIGQFSWAVTDDPHLHLKQFTEVVENFKIQGVKDDDFMLRLFPYAPTRRAKSCLNSLESNSLPTWRELVEKFLVKYFTPILNARKRKDITSFKKTNEETLFETWKRFK